MSGGFCTECGVRIVSFDGLTACPACGTTGIPCSDDNQVTVSVNWHELHLLCVWAEHYAHSIKSPGVVYAIARRLQQQFPDRHKLTLAAEIQEVKRQFGQHGFETNIPGVE